MRPRYSTEGKSSSQEIERYLERVEAVEAYRERVGWMLCGACGEMEAWNPEIQQFLLDCPRGKSSV